MEGLLQDNNYKLNQKKWINLPLVTSYTIYMVWSLHLIWDTANKMFYWRMACLHRLCSSETRALVAALTAYAWILCEYEESGDVTAKVMLEVSEKLPKV